MRQRKDPAKIRLSQFLLAIYCWMVCVFKNSLYTLWDSIAQNCCFSFVHVYQLEMASKLGMGGLGLLILSVLEPHVVKAHAGLMHAATISVKPYVHWSWCVCKSLFMVFTILFFIILFCSSSSWNFEPWRERFDGNIVFPP